MEQNEIREAHNINESIIRNHEKEFTYMDLEVIKEYSDTIKSVVSYSKENGYEKATMKTSSIEVLLRVSHIDNKRIVFVYKRQYHNRDSINATEGGQVKKFLNEC